MHLLVGDRVSDAEILKCLAGVGIGHAEIVGIGPSLEDVFVTLTQLHAGSDAARKEAA
jgi:hypothetical protein